MGSSDVLPQPGQLSQRPLNQPRRAARSAESEGREFHPRGHGASIDAFDRRAFGSIAEGSIMASGRAECDALAKGEVLVERRFDLGLGIW